MDTNSAMYQRQKNTQTWGLSFSPAHWKIGSKIVGIVLTIVLLSVTSLTVFSYLTLSRSTMESTGKEMLNHGHQALQRSADVVIGSEAPGFSGRDSSGKGFLGNIFCVVRVAEGAKRDHSETLPESGKGLRSEPLRCLVQGTSMATTVGCHTSSSDSDRNV